MNIDLLPIVGGYRGVSRNWSSVRIISTKNWGDYFPLYERYMDWVAAMDNSYTTEILQLLTDLRDETKKRGTPCEIVFYSDKPEEFNFANDFLGFDVYWAEEGISGLENGKYIYEQFRKELNDNGLFNTYENAQKFRDVWKANIDLDESEPWATSSTPLILWVWTYQV